MGHGLGCLLLIEFARANSDAASGIPSRWTECGEHTIKWRLSFALSRLKHGFDSRRERQRQVGSYKPLHRKDFSDLWHVAIPCRYPLSL